MQTLPRQFLWVLLFLIPSGAILAAPGDADNDGLRDVVETGTGIFVSPSDTGTNPNLADTDGDSLPDGLELTLNTNPNSAASKVRRPNIIYILTDDMGYGDVGCFWQNQRPAGSWKFATPGLDSMAAQGAMLTHHYVGAPVCASSRSSFLQGRHQGHADIRDTQFDKPLPDNHSLPATLKAAGYKTVHIGKAGLAGTDRNNPSAHPLTRGFDRFFGTLTHGQAQDHYPRNGTTAYLAKISNDFGLITDAYQDLYTQDVYTAFAKKTIIEETTQHPERPFFIYLSLDTPHFIGQFPPTRDYPAGKGLSGGLQWTGSPSYVNTAINDASRIDNVANRHPDVPSNWYPAAQKFVTMIRRMDDSVSDILQTLRDLGIDDNTLVVFTTDNGPDPTEIYPPSFQSYGPFEGIKTDLWEGGIRVPTIAWWPGRIPSTNNLTNIRQVSRACANYDWLATFAELAGIPAPAFTDGTSLVPALTGVGSQADRGYLYFEFSYGGFTSRYPDFMNHGGETRGYMQAIRVGDFKGIRYNIQSASDPFRIYNVVNDPKEGTDLAATRPDLVEKINRLSVSARRKGGGVIRPYDTALIPPISPSPVRNGVRWKSYEGYWPWLPEFRDLTAVATGQAVDISPALRSRENDVGLSFEGYLSVPASGAYTFQTGSNAATSLWIHDGHVIDNDYNFTATKTSDPVYLSAGLHPIRLYYRHLEGAASLELRYSGPGITMQKVPAAALFVDGQPTVLQADAAVTRTGAGVMVDVLANDTAQNPLTVTSVGTPLKGTAAINNGQILYTPAPGFIGLDQFSYSVNDGFVTVNSSVSVAVLFDNEIWLPLDEGVGTIVKAYGAPSPVDGILSGADNPSQSWTTGKLGKALKFDGMDDRVDFPALPLPLAGAPRTLVCWLKTTNTSLAENQTLFSYGPASGGQRFTVRLEQGPGAAGSLVACVEALPGKVIGTTALNDGRWHQLAVVVADENGSGSTFTAETKIHVDGGLDPLSSIISTLVSTDAGTSASLAGTDASPNSNFNGSLDEVRIFPRALAASEVQALYQNNVNTALASLPPGDSDGDGASDAAEEIAGTDPNDPASLLRILSLTRTPGQDFTLRWSAVSGRTYEIQESSDLLIWKPVPGLLPLAVSGSLTEAVMVIPDDGAPQRFFRVLAMITPLEALDDDGDGSLNGEEALAGTDPNDATSYFRIHDPVQTGSGMTLRWAGVAGRTYRVEESSALSNWTLVPGVAPVVVTENTPNASVTVPANGAPKRFLRMQVMLTQ